MLLNCAVVFQDDPSWKKVLEPLLSIERVCMSTVVCVEQVRRGEKGQKKKTGEIGNDDDDDDDDDDDNDDNDDDDDDDDDYYTETKRRIPVSVMNHVRKKGLPVLQVVQRQDRCVTSAVAAVAAVVAVVVLLHLGSRCTFF
jgi:hypothetical protein